MSGLPRTTLEGLESRRQDIVGLWGRRGFLIVLTVVVLAGLTGVLGVRTVTADAESDGWSVSLEYASVARAGLDVPWTATVSHSGGFEDEVTLALTADYLDLYETQAFHPEPSKTQRDGTTLYLTFDSPPDGEVFKVSYDAYIQPAAQQGRDGTLAVVVGGRALAPVTFRTRLLP